MGEENLSMEERSNVEERKLGILKEYGIYMEDHPELRQVLNDFICAVMTEKPKNIFKFARFWFKNSLPPLDVVASTEPKDVAASNQDLGDMVQSVEHVKRVSVKSLLARIYATIDTNSDKILEFEEFQASPFYGVWPASTWDRMDRDASGGVTPVEFFDFMKIVEHDEGKIKFHETVSNFVMEAEMNVMDLLPPTDNIKERLAEFSNETLAEYLFQEAVIKQSEDDGKDFVYRKEMQHSKIGVLMLPYWRILDEDEDGKVRALEWNSFFEKVMASEEGKAMAEAGENLLMDLFIDGGTNPLVTLATCASSCTAGTDYKAMAENVTNMLTVSGNVMGRLNVLKADSIDPILDCKFISEIFSALYYPLCVEANPGFTLITISNILSGVALILAFPIAVASTKRIKAKSEDKYADDDMYKGQA